MAKILKYIVFSHLGTLSKNIETGFVCTDLVASVLVFGIFKASSEAAFTKY